MPAGSNTPQKYVIHFAASLAPSVFATTVAIALKRSGLTEGGVLEGKLSQVGLVHQASIKEKLMFLVSPDPLRLSSITSLFAAEQKKKVQEAHGVKRPR